MYQCRKRNMKKRYAEVFIHNLVISISRPLNANSAPFHPRGTVWRDESMFLKSTSYETCNQIPGLM